MQAVGKYYKGLSKKAIIARYEIVDTILCKHLSKDKIPKSLSLQRNCSLTLEIWPRRYYEKQHTTHEVLLVYTGVISQMTNNC